MTTRRSFLHTVALTAVGVATTPAWAADRFSARPQPLRIRRNFNSLNPNGPEVAALRAGIIAMRSLDPATGLPTSKKSWGYQRGIHKYSLPYPSPLPTAWNTCTHHGSPGPAFLSWHRAYLYYFERICRAASGYYAFTLPYWNYDMPGQDALPPPFKNPNNTAANALYYSPRLINDGSVVDAGSRGEQDTITEPNFDLFQEAIQGCHDLTHGAVGGHMGSVNYAALDPIFYLHHCNIDRCWRHWQISNLPNNANPSPTPSWWGTPWTFFDESSAQVTMTGQQAEHTPTLGYVYDDEPKTIVPPIVIQLIPYIRSICQRYPILCQPLRLQSRPPWPLSVIGPRPTALPLELPAAQTQALREIKRRTGRSSDRGLLEMQLVIEWQEGSPNLVVEARTVGTKGDTGWLRGGAAGSFARGGARDNVAVDVSRLFGVIDDATSRHGLEWRVRFTSGRIGADRREVPLGDTKAQARVWGAKLTIPAKSQR